MCIADFLKKPLLQINSTGPMQVLLSRNVGIYNIHTYSLLINLNEQL